HARAAPVRRAHRRRARGRDARRVPARARGGADRDEHPLPPRAPADGLPRTVPAAAAAARRGAGGRRGAVAAALAGAFRRGRCGRDRRAPPRPHPLLGMRRRAVRVAATLVVTGLCTAYIVWKIDVSRTAHILGHARAGYFLLALGIMVVTVWPMAWRCERLLVATGILVRLAWL